MLRAHWKDELANEIARLSSEGLDSGTIEVEIPMGDVVAFFEKINRTNLLEFCGASPQTLLVGGFAGDRSSAVATFHWRQAGWDRIAGPGADGYCLYPPILFDELDPGDGASLGGRR